ncbi:MAG: mandelate racemase/muconate lactonizing enzyme family protein [Pseudomonadota bacterium]
MKITKIEVWDFCPPMRDGPYAMSHVVMDCIWGRIYRAETDLGIAGLGETVFPPSVPRAEQLDCIAVEPHLLQGLIGQDVQALADLAVNLRIKGKLWCGLAFGLETLCHDLQARSNGVPVFDLLGGRQARSVPDYFSISERTREKLRARIEIAGAARKVFQLKLGVGSRENDVEQVALVLGELGPDQTVLADANGGWSVERAASMIAAFDDARLVWEEPCSTYEANREVMLRTGARLMVDQCAASPTVAAEVIRDGLAHSLCIKPAFLGGLSVAREIRDACAEAGMKMRIDGPWCGDIASAAILHLAVGAAEGLLISGCDLREPVLIDPPLSGVVTRGDTQISPPDGAGLGIDLADGLLGPPEAVYQ